MAKKSVKATQAAETTQTAVKGELIHLSNVHDLHKIKVLFIPDIHGDYEALRSMLLEASYIDKYGKWVAGDRELIQVGDILDRGPLSLKAYNLLEELQVQATTEGGKVIRLLGNHELMYLQGYYKAPDGSNQQDNEFVTDNAIRNGMDIKKGDYWKQRIVKDIKAGRIVAAEKFGDRIVVHAGVVSQISQGKSIEVLVKEFNEKLLTAVENNNYNDPIFGSSSARGGEQEYAGIFWADFDEDLMPVADQLIYQIGGHNPDIANNMIRLAGHGRIINIDVGMSKHFGGGKDVLVFAMES